ncbi:MAG: helicase C-terminal domain-containing protein [Cyanobacteria bacterium J06598_1]
MIETEVHQRLRAYLREQGHTQWPHHLTMARLVARALRVGRSALIQIDSLAAYQGTHRLSYLIPALLWPEPAVLALPDPLMETVLHQDIPNLQQNLPVIKSVQVGACWPGDDFRGLLVTSAQGWLRDRLQHQTRFPDGIPTLIDGVSDLEGWIRDALSITLSTQDWDALMLAFPSQRDRIRDLRVQITHAIFQHPANPYSCHLITPPEQDLLEALHRLLLDYGDVSHMPQCWQTFWQRFFQPERLAWSQLNRSLGSVTLCCGPTEIDQTLEPLWVRQPVVLMGAALDEDKKANRYRARLGLGEMTCLRFSPDRHHDLIQLYLPERLPMPNTSHFQSAALQEIRALLGASCHPEYSASQALSPTVIIVGDVPLKAQFASVLASELGSRVQLESSVDSQGVLITGWNYWQAHQADYAPPRLLIVVTLPIPSLENPLVAGRVATYKKRRQDWFKSYLLPEALSTLQRAIAPVRSHKSKQGEVGVVALLDNRVNYRSYGRQILSALSPAARSSYLDPTWFHSTAFPTTAWSEENQT